MARKTKQDQIEELRAQLKKTTEDLADLKGRLEAAQVHGRNAYRFFGACEVMLENDLHCKVLALAMLADLDVFIPKDEDDEDKSYTTLEWTPAHTKTGTIVAKTNHVKFSIHTVKAIQ